MLPSKIGNQGFSILEVVIAGAIGIVLTMGVMSLASMSSKVNRVTEQSAEQLELNSLVRQILINPVSCTANFKGVSLDVANKNPTIVVPHFVQTDPVSGISTLRAPIVPKPTIGNGKVTVDPFQLIPWAALDTNKTTWLVRLRVTTHKTGDSTNNSSTSWGATLDNASTSDISLQVTVDGSNLITSCVDNTKDDIISVTANNALSERVCELNPDGNYVYDSTTGTCIVNKNCYSGTPPSQTSAACPTGMRITGCNLTGVLDPASAAFSIPRTYTGNTGNIIQSGGPPPFLCTNKNLTTNTVNCAAPAGANTTNAVCQACCLSIVQ